MPDLARDLVRERELLNIVQDLQQMAQAMQQERRSFFCGCDVKVLYRAIGVIEDVRLASLGVAR